MRALMLGVIAVAGCAVNQLNTRLPSFVGHHVNELVAAWGYPTDAGQFMNDVVFIWDSSQSGVMALPQSATTRALIGTTPLTATTSGLAFVPVTYSCRIQVGTDARGLIKTFHVEGDEGCQRYASALPH